MRPGHRDRLRRAHRGGVGVTGGVADGGAHGVGELAQHEPVLAADLLAGRLGVLGVAEAHHRQRRVPAAEPLRDVRRYRPVGDDQPGPGGLARAREPVGHLAGQRLRPGHADGVPPRPPRAGLAEQVGERHHDVGRQHAVAEGAAAGIRGHHPQPARWHRDRVAAEAVQHPQPRLQCPGPLDDHPVRGAAAEQRGDAVKLARGEPAPADVLPRVPHLCQRPQRRGHLADLRPVPEHLKQPGQQRVIGCRIVAAGRGPVRGRAGSQDVRQGRGGQADAEIEPGQVAGQHPDERAGPHLPGQRDQVTRDGALGQVEDRDRVPAGQPRQGRRWSAAPTSPPSCPRRGRPGRSARAAPRGTTAPGRGTRAGRLCQARNRRAWSSWAANRSRSCTARAAVTRRVSAATAAFSACRPRQALAAASRGQAAEGHRAQPGQRGVQPACPAEQDRRTGQQRTSARGRLRRGG